MLFFGSKSQLGIDIGTSTIKVVELGKTKENFELKTFGMVDVSSKIMEKMQRDIIEDTADIIRELLAKSKVKTKRAVVSLPNNVVFVTVIEMPSMSDKELKSAIEWEARRYIPLPLEEVTLSWSALRGDEKDPRIKVLLTAVPTTVIDNYLRMFKLAGVQPIALEIEALALIRSLAGARTDGFMIIDIGAKNSSLNIVDHGFLQIGRNMSTGGDTITREIAQSLKISFSRAEQFKMEMGTNSDMQQISGVIQSTIEGLKNEAAQLIKLYESKGGQVSEIIFTGSGASLPGLSTFFNDLGVKMSLGKPLQFISYDQKFAGEISKVALGLSVAVGLAMR